MTRPVSAQSLARVTAAASNGLHIGSTNIEEKVAGLRVFEDSGGKIAVCEAVETPGPGIDTLADLEAFRSGLSI